MKERPIIFSGPMIQAILEGRKTQTRRVIRPHKHCYPGNHWWVGPHPNTGWWAVDSPEGPPQRMIKDTVSLKREGFKCPYGQPGDRLWVRETWNAWLTGVDECDPYLWSWLKGQDRSCYDHSEIAYRATDEPLDPDQGNLPLWAPSIHMPRWASRIDLEVVNIRVERINEISEHDVLSEGVGETLDPIGTFAVTWDGINKKRGFAWLSNCWVWVVTFQRM